LVTQLQTVPWSFFSSSGVALTNIAQNADIIISDAIPPGFRGFLRDVNTIFTTTDGTIAYEKVYRSGGRTRFAAGITANSNGSFDLVLGQGDRVAIVLTTQGTGVLDITWDGEIQQQGSLDVLRAEPFIIDEIGIALGGGL